MGALLWSPTPLPDSASGSWGHSLATLFAATASLAHREFNTLISYLLRVRISKTTQDSVRTKHHTFCVQSLPVCSASLARYFMQRAELCFSSYETFRSLLLMPRVSAARNMTGSKETENYVHITFKTLLFCWESRVGSAVKNVHCSLGDPSLILSPHTEELTTTRSSSSRGKLKPLASMGTSTRLHVPLP